MVKIRTSRLSAKLDRAITGSFAGVPCFSLIGLALFLLVPLASADSDGYYCNGPGYIAVELRAFNTPGLEAPHVLKLAVFGGEQGPRWAGEAEMTDFQPTWMRCDASGVVITGWNGAGWVRYLIGEGDAGEFTVLDHDESAERPFGPPNAVLMNLGQWAIPGVIELQSINPKFRFELRITATERPAQGVIYRDHTSVLVQLDLQGRERNRLVLYEGTSEETID